MRHIDIVLLSVNTPLLCGVYEDNVLIEEISSAKPLLVSLPYVFESLLPTPHQNPAYNDSRIDAIYYANGPGSFSALKLTHIFLHTLSSLYDIELFATSSFYFTPSAYIKAFGTSYFYRNKEGEISLVPNEQIQVTAGQIIFSLPQILDKNAFNSPTEPLYILPPV